VVAAIAITVPAVTSGRIEPVWLAVAALLPLALFDVLATLPSSALAYQRLRGSAVRIAEVDAAPVTRAYGSTPIPAGFTGIELRGVTAGWVPGSDAIHDIDLTVLPGQHVTIVGPSGAGKSTLASVLLGFLPYRGSATLSGVELRDALDDDLRRTVGLLAQQAHIFDTSVADNVRVGDPSADDTAVEAALEAAQLTGWVAGLPAGIDTSVGSFGLAVSGGERQRIALARLLLANRPCVVLDEPTEHLDGPTADALTATLTSRLAGSTVITITHRLLGLEASDVIVELSEGRLVAQGTHAELLERDGWYAQQWRLERERQDMSLLLPSLPIGEAVPRR
jgi:ABC-type transport system involved in cytochrome bd biosynthesis fused ATPase/permease subunit